MQELPGSHVKICDTCTSVLVVMHHECTECKDLYVDSGTVYITAQMARDFATGQKKGYNTHHVNGFDQYLRDNTDFKKLWPHWDFQPRRIRGKITGLFHGTPLIRILSCSTVR